MKKFEFSLEKVLRIREFEEEQAKIELGKAISEVNRINSELEFIASERVKNNLARSSCVDINFLMSIEKYIEGLDLKKEELLNELAQAEMLADERRKILAECMQKRKVLEKLKENQKIAYNKLVEREEEKVLDEIKPKKN